MNHKNKKKILTLKLKHVNNSGDLQNIQLT